MSTLLPCSSMPEDMRNFEVLIDGEPLLEGYRRTRADRILCAVLCCGTRLLGLVLLVAAAVLIVTEDAVGALNLGVLGVVFLIGGMIGFRQFQNAPKQLVLTESSLEFNDSWTGLSRSFPRAGCLETRCGGGDEGCTIYVIHPDQRIDLLVEGLPQPVAAEIVERLNAHLCA